MSPKEILGVNVEGPKMVSKWTREQFAQAMQQLSDITSPASLADKLAACDGTGSMREIILVQLALTKCGYQPGTVDGLRARADGTASVTTQAVKKFQQDHGLKDDGVAGPVTMAELARTLLGGVATAASETAPRTVAGAEPIAPVPLTAPSVPAVTSEELPPIVVASEGGGVPDTARETVLKVPSWLKKDIPRQTAGGNGMLDPGPETALKVPSVPIKGDSLQVAQSTDTSVEHANPEEDYRQGEALIG